VAVTVAGKVIYAELTPDVRKRNAKAPFIAPTSAIDPMNLPARSGSLAERPYGHQDFILQAIEPYLKQSR
jgi:hypothetical protein